jgi:hypothetical protein
LSLTKSSNVEANFIIICACLPFLRHFLRRYAPKFIGEGSSVGARYFKNYHQGNSTTRSWRRKQGLTVLQDEIELAENGDSISSGVRIVKEVQWDVTEERNDRSPDAVREGHQRHVLPAV